MSICKIKKVLFMSAAMITAIISGEEFSPGIYQSSQGFSLPYQLHRPLVEGNQKYPLVLHFHGAGSWGSDNKLQLGQLQRMVTPEFQAGNPCFILAPQSPKNQKWVALDWSKTNHIQPQNPTPQLAAAIELARKLIKEEAIDDSRIYVTGQSMGGYAVWDAISRYPDFFAAAIAICGGGDVTNAKKLVNANISIRAFHGTRDPVVPVENSRKMVDALKKSGGNIQYTEFPETGHDAWNPAYRKTELWQWLFEQKKD